jgi:hypothetical protein
MNIWKTNYLRVRAKSLASKYKEEKIVDSCCNLEKSLANLPGFQELWRIKKVKHWNYPDLKSYSLGFNREEYARNYLLLKEVQDELQP